MALDNRVWTAMGLPGQSAPRGLDSGAIELVVVRVPVLEHSFRVVPTGAVAGKFSYQYTVASALLDGRATKWTFYSIKTFPPVQVLLLL